MENSFCKYIYMIQYFLEMIENYQTSIDSVKNWYKNFQQSIEDYKKILFSSNHTDNHLSLQNISFLSTENMESFKEKNNFELLQMIINKNFLQSPIYNERFEINFLLKFIYIIEIEFLIIVKIS